jgi:hypothetical protein
MDINEIEILSNFKEDESQDMCLFQTIDVTKQFKHFYPVKELIV